MTSFVGCAFISVHACICGYRYPHTGFESKYVCLCQCTVKCPSSLFALIFHLFHIFCASKVWPSGNSSTLPKQPKPQPMVHGEDNSLPESVEAETEEEVIVTVGEGHAVGLIKEEEADGDKGKVKYGEKI